MQNNERIILDARLLSMINQTAFRGVLENGHQLVAINKGQSGVEKGAVRAGDHVKVQMSPYDMSKGIIVNDAVE